MAEQVTLKDVQPDSFSLSGLRKQRKEYEEATLDDVTITVGFDSPDTFRHDWTFQDVESLEEYKEELERTKEAAHRRLKNAWWDKDEESLAQFKNEVSLRIINIPNEVDEFKEDKQKVDKLKEAIGKTQEVYEKTGSRGRNISIQQRLDNRSSNLEEYEQNLERVEENLAFEENVEDGDVFKEDRQRTSGDLTWYNEDGEERFFLVTSVGATLQAGQGGDIVKQFDDKEEAWNYYQNNKLA